MQLTCVQHCSTGGSVQIWRRSDCKRSIALAPGTAMLGLLLDAAKPRRSNEH